VLNVGGSKVFSLEVEEKLIDHPAIRLCAIVGVPNPKRPEEGVREEILEVDPKSRTIFS